MYESQFISSFRGALGLVPRDLQFVSGNGLDSAFAVSELATVSFAVAASAVADLRDAQAGHESDAAAYVTVDRALASRWFGSALTPVGWRLPSPWDALAGDYECADGWIRLHTNAPRHRAAALRVLGVPAQRAAVESAVREWTGEQLEAAVVGDGGCAAVMRTAGEWSRHPQGLAVADEPLVGWGADEAATPNARWVPTVERPLAGLRVLDLTRVIAGPVSTRFLAGLGADVLRVDPPDWDEPAIVPEMTLGKRATRIDAREPVGRDALERLIAGADLLVHGYRLGALDALVPADRRAELRPGLVEVSLDAYGFTGPWAGRRGFDSLVQMSSGIADAGMRWAGTGRPTPLPVQALDHATGYLAAAAALRALTRLRREGVATSARVSLARVAVELRATGPTTGEPNELQAGAPPQSTHIMTPWGAVDLLDPPVEGLNWQRGPRNLGSDGPRW
ncbi:CoA transferase [Conyzicola lurida]